MTRLSNPLFLEMLSILIQLPEINHQIPDFVFNNIGSIDFVHFNEMEPFVINNIDRIDFVQYLNEMDPIYLVKENEIALAGKFDGQKLEVFRNNPQRKEEWFVGTKGQGLDNLIIVLPVKTKHILDILMIRDIIE